MSLKNNGKCKSEELLSISSTNGISKKKRQRTKTNCSNHSSKSETNARDNKISKSLYKMMEKIKTLDLKSRNSSGRCRHSEVSPKDSRSVDDESSENFRLLNKESFRDFKPENKAAPKSDNGNCASKQLEEATCGKPFSVLSSGIKSHDIARFSESVKDNEDKSELSVTTNQEDDRKLAHRNVTSRNKSRQLMMEKALKLSGLPQPTEEHFRKIINESLPDPLDNMNKPKKIASKKLKEGKKALDLQVPETFCELSSALFRVFNWSSNRSPHVEFSEEYPKKIEKLEEFSKSNGKQMGGSANSAPENFLINEKSLNKERVQSDLPEIESDNLIEFPTESKSTSAGNQFENRHRSNENQLFQRESIDNFIRPRSDGRRSKSMPNISSLIPNYFALHPRLDGPKSD